MPAEIAFKTIARFVLVEKKQGNTTSSNFYLTFPDRWTKPKLNNDVQGKNINKFPVHLNLRHCKLCSSKKQ